MSALVRVLQKLDAAIAAVELVIALVALAAILVLTAAPIALRVGGGNAAALWWATPVSLYLMLTSTFFAASLALRERRHIQIDIVTRLLPRRGRAGLGVASWLVAALVLGVLCAASIHYVRVNWDQISKVRGISLGPIQIAMPIALGVMTFRCLLAWLTDLRGAVTGDVAYMAKYEHHEGIDLDHIPHPSAPPADPHDARGGDAP